jgi:hypothetical protein
MLASSVSAGHGRSCGCHLVFHGCFLRVGHTAARTDGMSAAAYRGMDLRLSMIEFKTS